MADKEFADLKRTLAASSPFKDIRYSEKSKKKTLRQAYMRAFVRSSFVFCMTALLLFLFVKNDGKLSFMPDGPVYYFVILLIAAIAAGWLSLRLADRLETIPYRLWIQSAASLGIALFFVYQLFAPYFYSIQTLENESTDKIDMYFQLGSESLNQEDLYSYLEEAVNEPLASVLFSLDRYPDEELNGFTIVSIDRDYYYYTLTAEVELNKGDGIEKRMYEFEFVPADGTFKINGVSILD